MYMYISLSLRLALSFLTIMYIHIYVYIRTCMYCIRSNIQNTHLHGVFEIVYAQTCVQSFDSLRCSLSVTHSISLARAVPQPVTKFFWTI